MNLPTSIWPTIGGLLVGGAAIWQLTLPDNRADRPNYIHKVRSERFERVVSAEGYLKAERATGINAPRGQARLRIAWLKDNGSAVKAGEVVIRFDQDDFKRKRSDGVSKKELADAKLASERTLVRKAASDRTRASKLARLELARAEAQNRVADDDIFSRHEILTSRIDGALSRAKVEHANASLRVDRSISRSKLKLLEIEKKGAELEIERAEQALARMQVTAPHDGIFVYAHSELKAGDWVYPGQRLAKLPLVNVMEAEVFVLEADAMGLEKGKRATVVLGSQPEVSYKASIKSVASLAKPRQREVPLQYFTVVLALEKTDTSVMKPGQRVRAKLELEAREALVVPRQCIFEVDSKLVAHRYRPKAGSFEAVGVKLGPGTLGRVVIESGLAAGDLIATRDPRRPAKAAPRREGSAEGGVGP